MAIAMNQNPRCDRGFAPGAILLALVAGLARVAWGVLGRVATGFIGIAMVVGAVGDGVYPDLSEAHARWRDPGSELARETRAERAVEWATHPTPTPAPRRYCEDEDFEFTEPACLAHRRPELP